MASNPPKPQLTAFKIPQFKAASFANYQVQNSEVQAAWEQRRPSGTRITLRFTFFRALFS